MRVADKGFFPWLYWALCKWNGGINRLPYLGALCCLLLLLILYDLLLMAYSYAVSPLSAASAADIINMLNGLEKNTASIIAVLALNLVGILLDAKRLRSFGAPPWVAVIMNSLSLLRNVDAVYKVVSLDENFFLSSVINIAILAYGLVLLLVPPQSTARPVNPKYAGQAGTGPRRLSGKELSNWRLIAPAPRSPEDEGK